MREKGGTSNDARPAGATAPLSRLRAGAVCLILSLGLGACTGGDGGGGEPSDASGPIEDGEPRGEPDTGSATTAGLRFVVAEDEVLDGVLGDATRPGAVVSGRFGVSAPPSRGSLELLPDGRTFRYAPRADFNGTDAFEYRAGEAPPLRATIDVTPVPDAPVLLDDGVPLVAEVDRPFERRLAASDADGDALGFEASGLPDWLTLDGGSGLLSGRPTEADVGRVDGIVLAAVDPSGLRGERRGVVVEVVRPSEVPALDPGRLPASLDGGERRVVELFDAAIGLDGVTLDVSVVVAGADDPGPDDRSPDDPGPDDVPVPLDARLDGRRLVLEADEIVTVTDVTLVLALTDPLGQRRETRSPITLFPRSGSGRGTTLLGSRRGPGVHLVVIGDGYLAGQQALLRVDAMRVVALLREDPATARHLGAFNIHVVESVSEDAGAVPAGAPDGSHSTAFSSRYGCNNVAQLICADVLAAFTAAGEDYDVDHVVMLVNDERFGGSGSAGGIAIAARGVPAVALHELGHSLAGLGDEYVDSALVNELAPRFVEGLFPNLTAITDPARVPWAAWIEPGAPAPVREGEPGVGLFEGGLYRTDGVFRPTSTSRMREYDQPFGPVNGEQWVLGVYAVNTVRDFAPKVSDIALAAGETARFSVAPFFPPDVQAIEWWLDDERLRRADDARELEITPGVGTHRLRLLTRDISGLIRTDPGRAEFEWNWTIEVR